MPGALGLRTDADAAVDRGNLQVRNVGDRAEILRDLARELTRRREDQRRRAAAARRQPLDDRHGERERLARPGPRAREHVATGERVGDHEALDLERTVDPAHAQSLFGPGGHAELGEGPGVRGQHGAALGWVLMHHYLDFLCRRSAARREPAEPHRNESCERVGSARRRRALPRRSRLAWGNPVTVRDGTASCTEPRDTPRTIGVS